VANDQTPSEPAETTEVPHTPTPTARPEANPFTELGRYLYTSNPFYLISAGLVLTGLGQGFRAESDADALAVGLASPAINGSHAKSLALAVLPVVDVRISWCRRSAA
jgi:hypothetical protein